MIDNKIIGLILAISSTFAIGCSTVITKKGLNHASKKHGFDGEGYSYLKSPLWWGGIITMVIGEVANFAAYAFAPAILVTPLGALSVLISAVLGVHFLQERLGTLGKLGCATCLIGSVIIILHAPPDKEVETISEILDYAIQPGFLLYCISVIVFDIVMIYKIAPIYGRENPLVYLSICSSVGSISICAIKGLGIALRLTFSGNNQLTHPSTYVFLVVTVVAILTQMNYLTKALSQFNTNIVNPLYYVTFTTCTLVASFILFRGFNTSDAINTVSLLCGFLVIFSGVYLLNIAHRDPEGINDDPNYAPVSNDDVTTDPIGAICGRISMQSIRSHSHHTRTNSLNLQTFGNTLVRLNSFDRFPNKYHGDRESDRRLYDVVIDDDKDDGDEFDDTPRRASGSRPRTADDHFGISGRLKRSETDPV